ncbi:hypothetical protein [Kineococcus aurantiacus]|uniref:LemA family protein n=1 Tax=Kineococcus aurantiacus TaxID=37633 RepID=A0A7Y9DM93_9ACTN|nr:hypothetical protein [Kineococcus aurantiacus]NYD23175.1 hypothetical protein [Kineococcus aurantiacus]
MGAAGTVVLVLVVLLVLVVALYAVSTRAALVRLRDLAVEAGALAEQRRSRLADLSSHVAAQQAADAEPDPQTVKALADAEHRLAGDVAFHSAAVRAYDARLHRVPASWVGALSGLHPLGAAAEN